jgi:hypothetical protein
MFIHFHVKNGRKLGVPAFFRRAPVGCSPRDSNAAGDSSTPCRVNLGQREAERPNLIATPWKPQVLTLPSGYVKIAIENGHL